MQFRCVTLLLRANASANKNLRIPGRMAAGKGNNQLLVFDQQAKVVPMVSMRKLFVGVLMIFAMASISHAQAMRSGESCRQFVQNFYDWYAAKAQSNRVEPSPLDIALRDRVASFSPDLARETKEVLNTEARHHQAWLDFDPILNTQDPAKRYAVGEIIHKGTHCLVKIYALPRTGTSMVPDVVPELVRRKSGWTFVNFHYPDESSDPRNENLAAILKIILREIQQTSKAHPMRGSAGVHR